MRIRSNVLTEAHLYTALQSANVPGVSLTIGRAGRGRGVLHSFDVYLEAVAGWDRHGTSRRMRGFGAGGIAATYYEWGYWMVELFKIDSEAIVGQYNGVEDFHAQTGGQFRNVDNSRIGPTISGSDLATLKKDVARFVKRNVTPEGIVSAYDNRDEDCWLCLLGQGDMHLAEHMREHYLPWALIRNAVVRLRYRNPDFALSFILRGAQNGRLDGDARKAVREYLVHHLAVRTRASVS
jgi:hypothetical protein